MVEQVAFQVIALLGRVSARHAAVDDGQGLPVGGFESLDPWVHVRDAVSHEYDAALGGRENLKQVEPVLAKRLVGPRRHAEQQSGEQQT